MVKTDLYDNMVYVVKVELKGLEGREMPKSVISTTQNMFLSFLCKGQNLLLGEMRWL